ncbi:MAG: hypothetical protein K2Y37_12740 [Pirellulales bacterium]|nr:hypothetical protein [Pirellulales bacterium]
MSVDLLDRLGETEVPPVPTDFESQLHDRVNNGLLAAQMADFIVRAMPAVFVEFSKALLYLLAISLTGREPPRDRRPTPRQPRQ